MFLQDPLIFVLLTFVKKSLFFIFTAVQLGETRKITVLTHLTDRPHAPCAVVSTSPSGKTLEMPMEKIPEGYEVLFTPEEKGNHKVKVTFSNQEVPNSPFSVNVEAVDVSGVIVKGLEKRKSTNSRKSIGDFPNFVSFYFNFSVLILDESPCQVSKKEICKTIVNTRRNAFIIHVLCIF